MRVGGLVIHGDAKETLGACLEGLLAVCDEVVAVDSGSTDGSAELVRASGVRRVEHPWRGYGAARAAGAEALGAVDWIFFLDSDERLGPGAVEAFARWRQGEPQRPLYRVRLRDWAELPTGRFLYRRGRPVRLLRREAAGWRPSQIVHEAPPRLPAGQSEIVVDHRFATSVEDLVAKQDRYALLWAVRAFGEGRGGGRPGWVHRLSHVVRDGLLKGALVRGGVPALRLAWAVSRYHALKHRHLRDLRKGKHPGLVAAFEDGRYEELLRQVADAAAG